MMKMKLILFLFALLFALLGFASLVSGQGNEHSYSLPFRARTPTGGRARRFPSLCEIRVLIALMPVVCTSVTSLVFVESFPRDRVRARVRVEMQSDLM